jgi:hypothetical protein
VAHQNEESPMYNRRTAAAALTLATVLALPVAYAQSESSGVFAGQPVRILKDSAAERVVSREYEGRFSFVRIEASEAGAAANEHPLRTDAASLRAQLQRIVIPGRTTEVLMTEAQLDEIAAPLAAALGKATAAQDVAFAVSDRHSGFGPLALRAVTTGRVFQRDGQLNVIFGLVRRDFESQFRGSGVLIAFEPGQRAKVLDTSQKLQLAQAADGKQTRSDWFALSAVAAAPAAAAPPAASTSGAAAPVAPAAGAATAPPRAATPAEPGDAAYRAVAERLRALEKLRKDGLITEQEYQDKRREILKSL